MRAMTEFRREIGKLRCTGWGVQLAKRLVGELDGDELDVVGLVMERLQLGRERYGEQRVAADVRDWKRERREELVDALIYDVIDRRSAPAREEASAVSAPHARPSLPGGECEGTGVLDESVPAGEEANGVSAPPVPSSPGGPDAARAPGSGGPAAAEQSGVVPPGEAGEGARTLASGAQLVGPGHDAACWVLDSHLAPLECWVEVGGSG